LRSQDSDGVQAAGDEEARLWEAYCRDASVEVRARLFEHYAVFARGVARRLYRARWGSDLDFADFCQHAYTGLLEAIDRFDSERGTAFRSFAVHRIEGSIRDAIVHMSEYREQMSWRQRLRHDRLASLKEGTAKETSSPVEQLADIAMGLALGFMLEGTGIVVADADPGSPPASAYESVAWAEALRDLAAALEALPEREHKILKFHYLDGVCFDDLAKLLGLSKGRVSQLHSSALKTLRRRLRQAPGFGVVK
jgi:RNA polymerase sigma factor FliA